MCSGAASHWTLPARGTQVGAHSSPCPARHLHDIQDSSPWLPPCLEIPEMSRNKPVPRFCSPKGGSSPPASWLGPSPGMVGLWGRDCASHPHSPALEQYLSAAAIMITKISCPAGAAPAVICVLLSQCKTRGTVLDPGRFVTPFSRGIQRQAIRSFGMMNLRVLSPRRAASAVLMKAAPVCWSRAEHSCLPAAAPSPRPGCFGECWVSPSWRNAFQGS